MKTNHKATLTISTLAVSTLIWAPAAFADPVATSVIAQDPTPAPTVAPDATVIGVDANLVAGLSVTGARGKPVTVTTKGKAPRTATAAANTLVVFRNLTPGAPYAVAIAGTKIGTATPLAAPGTAYGLTVSTTPLSGSVQLDWQHQAARAEGKITYTITATPSANQPAGSGSRSAAQVATVRATSDTTSATLSGLDASVLYTFTVTPTNTAAAGQASTAAMTRTLADLAGTGKTVADVAPIVKTFTDPAPAPTPAPAPGPVGPSARTIYVCPSGFTDAGSLCNKTMTYTFHSVTTTSPYSYHQQFIQTGSHVNYSASPNGGTYYAKDQWNPTDGSAEGYYAVIPDGYYASVKDAPPAGYTDNGSAYSKTELVKDTAPAGYSDNGTAWVTTAAKVAQEVPA